MPTIEIRVPQLGEGLVEVRIVHLAKTAGDPVRRDEPIYTMETDKAEVEIESPTDGILESWAVQEGDIVPVGSVVAQVAVDGAEQEATPKAVSPPAAEALGPSSPGAALRNVIIPPRTRAYAKEKGLKEEEIMTILGISGKLMPADIDTYLAARGTETSEPKGDLEYEEVPMSPHQRTLFYRLSSTTTQVVTGVIEAPVAWGPVEQVHEWFKEQDFPEEEKPSKFLLVAWCVVQALPKNESFRSTAVDGNTLRRYRHGNLGIAVALPHDELTTAVVSQADTLPFTDFVKTAKACIQSAREGVDQAGKTVAHLALTSMTAFGVRTAVPVVVPPSIATLFVGSPHDAIEGDGKDGIRLTCAVNLVLAFDHRIINGIGAASFLSHVKDRIASLPKEFGLDTI